MKPTVKNPGCVIGMLRSDARHSARVTETVRKLCQLLSADGLFFQTRVTKTEGSGLLSAKHVVPLYSASALHPSKMVALVSDVISSLRITASFLGGSVYRLAEFSNHEEVRGIKCGDAIYDSFARNRQRYVHPKRHPFAIFTRVLRAHICVRWWENKASLFRPSYLVLSSTASLEGKILARAALQSGTTVLVIKSFFARRLDRTEETDELFWAPREQTIREIESAGNWEQSAENYLRKRLSGFKLAGNSSSPVTRDSSKAFMEKARMSRSDFCRHFIPAGARARPIVVFALHVFADAPHNSGPTIFRDYYEAFDLTLAVMMSTADVNWFIRPHPSSESFGELRLITERLSDVGEHVQIWPEQVSVASAFEWASGFITVTGTIGLEAACYGSPVLLSGQPFYGGLGFCKNPKTRSEYFQELRTVASWEPLTKEQMGLARKALLAHHNVLSPVEPSKLSNQSRSFIPFGPAFELDEAVQMLVSRRSDRVWLRHTDGDGEAT